MDSSGELQYIALARFDKAYLQPSVSEYSSLFQRTEITPWLENFYFADLFEGYLWLQLGISLDVFPVDAARELVRQRLAGIFPRLPSFLDFWGYVLSADVNDLVLAAMNQKEFFVESTLAQFDRPERFAPSFQSAWLLETRFARDPYARGFVTALNFRYEDLMQQVAHASIMSNRGQFAKLEEDIGIEPRSISLGSLRTMEHVSEFGFFFEHLAEQEFERFDELLFSKCLREICGWRVDFGRARAHQVLLGLVDSIPTEVPDEIRGHLDLGFIESGLRRYLSKWQLEAGAAMTA